MNSLRSTGRRLLLLVVLLGLVTISGGNDRAEAVPGFCPLDAACVAYCWDICNGGQEPCHHDCYYPSCCLR